MRFGAQFWQFDWPGGPAEIGPKLAESGRILDEAGADALYLMDHYFQMEWAAPAEDPMLEGYTSLGFLAGVTRHVELGLMVTSATYRHPGLLGKITSTLDVLSGGRALLGIGAGWYEREHLGLGVPFPSTAERFERLEETLQIVRQMWSGEVKPYEGTHYQLAEALNRPLPLHRPRILIGGSGEKKTLRLAARYADACNLFPMGAEEVAHKLDVLRGHCETEGTDYDAIGKTILYPMGVDDVDAALAGIAPYAELGIESVIFGVAGDPVEYSERLATGLAKRLADL
jgi:F420-dependent oxidoreductase-like protein